MPQGPLLASGPCRVRFSSPRGLRCRRLSASSGAVAIIPPRRRRRSPSPQPQGEDTPARTKEQRTAGPEEGPRGVGAEPAPTEHFTAHQLHTLERQRAHQEFLVWLRGEGGHDWWVRAQFDKPVG